MRERWQWRQRFSLRRRALALAIVGSAAGLASAAPHPLRSAYDDLQQWQFTSTPLVIPEGGLGWQIDTAEWYLETGRIWIQRPSADGETTGFVFEGSGRFQMTVPDPVELRQLRRFARDPKLETLAETFDALVVRSVSMAPNDLLLASPASDFSTHPLARERHEHWLTLRSFDADARIVAALGRAVDAYVRVDMRTDGRGWLTYDYDSQRAEEIVVEWFNPSYRILESWLSLDRPEDRAADGRPTGPSMPNVDLEHFEVDVDLTEFARESPRGVAKVRPMVAKIETEMRFTARNAGDRSLQLFLHPWAKVEAVADEDGRPLEFARDHLGKRSSVTDNRVYDDSLVIFLEQPLVAGASRRIVVRYELELAGYAPGRIWYPSTLPPGSGLTEVHTARLRLTCRDNFAVRASGSLQSEKSSERSRTTVWIMDRPVKMMSFVFAKRYHEDTLQAEGVWEVVTFGSLGGYLSRPRIEKAGSDVANGLHFFTRLFGRRMAEESLQVSLIPASHGQAFDGLLHIGDFSTLTNRVAEQELFRSHEVAHLWWGHAVGWQGYRDQWLSEGFAEYSAMMFIEATLDQGSKYFDEMLKAITDELTGSIESAFSQFNRPGVSLLNLRAADRVGPIGHGRRCVVGEAPTAYFSQAYKKGALVLHMLRMLLRATTGSDRVFFETLRTFIDRYEGGSATTADFEAVLEDVAATDWSWFFAQWVLGAEIPTYRWSHEVDRTENGHLLRLRVTQQDVEPEFRMAIPVRVEFADGRAETVVAFSERASADFEFTLEDEPRRVVFNPDYSVLARVKRR